jgi:hypothetical protein
LKIASSCGVSLSRLQVLNAGGPAQVVEILASTEVASARTLALPNVGEAVFDGDTLAESLPSRL